MVARCWDFLRRLFVKPLSEQHPYEPVTPSPAVSIVVNQLLNPQTGAALAYALLVSQQWKFRRVESLRLLAGPSARRRVSLDLMPPPDVALAYHAAERRRASIDEVRGSVMVPLTLMQKGARVCCTIR